MILLDLPKFYPLISTVETVFQFQELEIGISPNPLALAWYLLLIEPTA